MPLSSFDPVAAANVGGQMTVLIPGTYEVVPGLTRARVSGGEPLIEADGQPVTIHVLGHDGEAVQAELQAVQRERARGEEVSDEDAALRIMSVAVIGWSDNLCIHDPGDLPFNPENVKKLLTDENTRWLREQIGPFSMDRRKIQSSRKTG